MGNCASFSIAFVLAAFCAFESLAVPQGGSFSVERRSAIRSRTITFGDERQEVELVVNLDYPSPFGLSAAEHASMAAFVDGLLFGGASFDRGVDALASNYFERVQTVALSDWEYVKGNPRFALNGMVFYADSRYLSYEAVFSPSFGVADIRGTFDRVLGRRLHIADFVLPNAVETLRWFVRENMRGRKALDQTASDYAWPMLTDDFTVGRSGVTWSFSESNTGVESQNVRLAFDDDRKIERVFQPSCMPTGEFSPPDANSGASNSLLLTFYAWWRLSYDIIVDATPVSAVAASVQSDDCATSAFALSVENPLRGGMSETHHAALQRCLASAIGFVYGVADCETVSNAVGVLRGRYEAEFQKAYAKMPVKAHWWAFEADAQIGYAGRDYASYSMYLRAGDPNCGWQTNVVWSWRHGRQLGVLDVFDAAKTNRVAQLALAALKEVLRDELDGLEKEERAECVASRFCGLDDFWLDGWGVCWMARAKRGPRRCFEFGVPWKDLSSCVQKGFVVPEREPRPRMRRRGRLGGRFE